MASVLKHTMVVRNPETLEATALLEGSELPDWATDLVHEDNLTTGSKSSSSSSTGGDTGTDYAGKNVDELQKLADERQLTVEGTGKDGNVLKGDLVTALQADDASKA